MKSLGHAGAAQRAGQRLKRSPHSSISCVHFSIRALLQTRPLISLSSHLSIARVSRQQSVHVRWVPSSPTRSLLFSSLKQGELSTRGSALLRREKIRGSERTCAPYSGGCCSSASSLSSAYAGARSSASANSKSSWRSMETYVSGDHAGSLRLSSPQKGAVIDIVSTSSPRRQAPKHIGGR